MFDFVGVDATMALGAAVVRPRGHLTIVGIGGGSLPVGFFTIPYEVTLSTTYWGTIPELHELIALAARGDIAPVVQRYALADATRRLPGDAGRHARGPGRDRPRGLSRR